MRTYTNRAGNAAFQGIVGVTIHYLDGNTENGENPANTNLGLWFTDYHGQRMFAPWTAIMKVHIHKTGAHDPYDDQLDE